MNARQGVKNKVAPPFRRRSSDHVRAGHLTRGEIIELGQLAGDHGKSGAWYA